MRIRLYLFVNKDDKGRLFCSSKHTKFSELYSSSSIAKNKTKHENKRETEKSRENQ